eukprot:365623-Chlamydomonas_euryale.AAC.4
MMLTHPTLSRQPHLPPLQHRARTACPVARTRMSVLHARACPRGRSARSATAAWPPEATATTAQRSMALGNLQRRLMVSAHHGAPDPGLFFFPFNHIQLIHPIVHVFIQIYSNTHHSLLTPAWPAPGLAVHTIVANRARQHRARQCSCLALAVQSQILNIF